MQHPLPEMNVPPSVLQHLILQLLTGRRVPAHEESGDEDVVAATAAEFPEHPAALHARTRYA